MRATAPLLNAEQIENRQMLPGLRHGAIVGGDDEQGEVDSRHARQHVVDESLVAWHIYESDGLARLDRQIGEAEIDRHASLLFFGQPIRVHAGERLHQQRLPVIDMSRGCDDHSARSAMKIQRVQLIDERRLVFQAAEIENERAVLYAANHGDGQFAERARDALQGRTGAALSDLRPDQPDPRSGSCAWARRRFRSGFRRGSFPPTRFPRASEATGFRIRSAIARISSNGRASSRNAGRRSARRSGFE